MKFISNPDRGGEIVTGIVCRLDSRISRQRQIDGEDNERGKEMQGEGPSENEGRSSQVKRETDDDDDERKKERRRKRERERG